MSTSNFIYFLYKTAQNPNILMIWLAYFVSLENSDLCHCILYICDVYCRHIMLYIKFFLCLFFNEGILNTMFLDLTGKVQR